jgi:hypothetical protein
MNKKLWRGCVAATLVAAPIAGASLAQASEATVYVSPSGSASRHDTSCDQARYRSVQQAVNAVAGHGTVVVCAGTYPESVTVKKALHLAGRSGAIINAAGQAYGVGVAAPYVTVSGLTVKNAQATDQNPGDGIITAGFGANGPVPADHVTVVGNLLENNDGAGIDLNSTSNSVARQNVSVNNGIGVNVVDDLGKPSSHNVISGNTANNNPGGCGIVLAEHTGAGIFANLVEGNTANNNGLGTSTAPNASSGSGIILAGGPPGPNSGVYNNTVRNNFFAGNGHAGVAFHSHAPGLNFSGNKVLDNVIGTNNTHNDYADSHPTGVYIGDVDPLTINVAGNTIRNNYYGIFTAGPVTVTGSNHFFNVAVNRGATATYGG